MKNLNETTLAETLEQINATLNEIKNKQIELEKQLKQNNKILMKRINKLQEYNEINDMREIIANEHIDKIAKMILEIEKKLY